MIDTKKSYKKLLIKIVKFLCLFACVVFISLYFVSVLRGYKRVPKSIIIGPLEIRLYGMIVSISVLLLMFLHKYHFDDTKSRQLRDGIVWYVIPAIIIGRLWHVVTDFNLYRNDLLDTIKVWNGGIGIFGVILGGILGIVFYCRYKRISILRSLESIAIFLPIAQSFGRIANFINQELFGPPTNLPWGVYIRMENRPNKFKDFAYFHPTFFYESIGTAILFMILFTVFKKRGIKNDGFFIALYLIGYGIIRFTTGFLRLDPEAFRSLNWGQLNALVFIFLGFLYFGAKKLRTK